MKDYYNPDDRRTTLLLPIEMLCPPVLEQGGEASVVVARPALEDMATLELPLERQLQKPFVEAVRHRRANRVLRCRRSGSIVFLNVEKIQFRSSE